MYATHAALVLFKDCGIGAPWEECCHAVALPRGERGEVLRVFGGTSGDQLWVDRPDVKGCFWEARWGGEDPVHACYFVNVCLFQTTQLNSTPISLSSLSSSGAPIQRERLLNSTHQWNGTTWGGAITYQRIIGLGTHHRNFTENGPTDR